MKTKNTIATKRLLASAGMKVKTNVKAGGNPNHNQTFARDIKSNR